MLLGKLCSVRGVAAARDGVIRKLSTNSVATSIAKLQRRSVLALEGRDTYTFLQGAITNNVKVLEEDQQSAHADPSCIRNVFYSAFLNPQGRTISDALMYPVAKPDLPSVLVEVDSDIVDDLMKFLKRFKLRSKFNMNNVSKNWNIYQVWGPDAEKALNLPAISKEGGIVAQDHRAPFMGWRVLLPSEASISITTHTDVSEVSSDEYKAHRMLCGVAEGASELVHGASLPLEACIDYMQGGTHSTNALHGSNSAPVSRHVDPSWDLDFAKYSTDVRLVTQDQPESSEDKPKRARSAGKFLGGVHNVGLALLRLEQVEQTLDSNANKMLIIESEDGPSLQLHASRPDWWPPKELDRNS
ncbi:ccr4 associated factor [Malassezia yamatoensis]|uniref:Ccr4 associated factor n=1 Tax=Malassezia yamatoensis TaxID=253288 RepID=A0AAJ5YUR1_9BASI|nr:ccr4 associated factor [Malassezia yamatoensis]